MTQVEASGTPPASCTVLAAKLSLSNEFWLEVRMKLVELRLLSRKVTKPLQPPSCWQHLEALSDVRTGERPSQVTPSDKSYRVIFIDRSPIEANHICQTDCNFDGIRRLTHLDIACCPKTVPSPLPLEPNQNLSATLKGQVATSLGITTAGYGRG